MSTVWGSAYCWTTASCLNNSHLLGLPDEANPSAAAVDQAEKTDQENEMEKYKRIHLFKYHTKKLH